jgi:hypothetical protein
MKNHCEYCMIRYDEEELLECTVCGRTIGLCCLSDLDDPPYCVACEKATREEDEEDQSQDQ